MISSATAVNVQMIAVLLHIASYDQANSPKQKSFPRQKSNIQEGVGYDIGSAKTNLACKQSLNDIDEKDMALAIQPTRLLNSMV